MRMRYLAAPRDHAPKEDRERGPEGVEGIPRDEGRGGAEEAEVLRILPP